MIAMSGLKNEIWKPIEDSEYEVSSCGRVRKSKCTLEFNDHLYEMDGIMLRPYMNNNCLFVNFNAKSHAIHKLVASAFLENTEYERCVTHLDGDLLNNHYTNLAWSAGNIVNLNNCKAVQCLQDNKYFKSIKCAAIYYNLSYAKLCSIINKNKSLQGLSFVKISELPEGETYQEVDESKGCYM